MTEQIWANEIRFYRETSPRSGTPDGTVWLIPVGPAAAARRVEGWSGRTDVFRQPHPLTPMHEYHEGRMSFTVGLKMLAWLLREHASDRGVDGFAFDRNTGTPTFCLEIQTPSDAFAFRGVAFNEIQIGATPPELLVLDVSWMALDRVEIDELTAATGDLYSAPEPSNRSVMAYAAGAWGADPRVDDFYPGSYAIQLFLTRRDLAPAQFMPDGRPERFSSAPWRVMADMKSAANDLTRQAKTRAAGRLALFLGDDGIDLELIADNASFYTNEEPIKAVDFREEGVMVEMHPDATGSLLNFRDNSGLIP